MTWLVVVHVLSAMLGLGPAYAFPLMLREANTTEEMRGNMKQVAYLEVFPKVFGTLAVLSGLALVFLNSYGPFTQAWIIGSLAVYVAIEVLVIGFLNPAANKLMQRLSERGDAVPSAPDAEMIPLYVRVRNLHLWAGLLGLAIFILMIAKPQ